MPEWTEEQRSAGWARWQQAIERTLGWVEVD
jgi:glycerol kinase